MLKLTSNSPSLFSVNSMGRFNGLTETHHGPLQPASSDTIAKAAARRK
ncbi:hypothetical protein AB0K60_12185 [Thermopolyspora sp. NPDC052614]